MERNVRNKETDKLNIRDLQELLNDMSLEEKIGQMVQITGGSFENDGLITGPEKKNGLGASEIRLAGSVIGSSGADKLKRIQQEYMENHPHRIPLLFMSDVINGYRTIFPIPLAQGSSFDPEMSGRAARVAAKEASVSGLHLTFSPMADLVNDARWGRVMESTGEDPWLNSQFAGAMVEGYQGKDAQFGKNQIAACVKHFAAYGAPLAGREYNTVELSERTLRDAYLPSYQAAVDAGVSMVMTSFNTLNRIPASGNKQLMRQILRDEMGFEGVVISDWGAIEELIPHGVAEDGKEAARLAVDAGVDIDMCTASYAHNLKKLVEDKVVSEDLIDEAVMRILKLKNQLGLFENPYRDADALDEKECILCEAHRLEARKFAGETFVLLKNENVLPLKNKEEKTAFIGPQVYNHEIIGSWSIFGRAKDTVSIADALKKRVPGAVLAEGSAFADGRPGTGVMAARAELHKEDAEAERLLQDAKRIAAEVDTVVLALGEHQAFSGEAKSRADISVPDCQMRLFREVQAVNPNVVVVLFTGRPLDIREISQKAKAILVVWQPGTEGGNAVVDALYGDVNPSGKLAMSFPYCVGQVPVFYNEMRTGRPYGLAEEAYSSTYLDIPNKPLYPFGFGLSYTSFDISPVELDGAVMGKDGEIRASVRVKNTGNAKGKEVLQLYIRDHVAKAARPVRELKAIRKVELNAGEEKIVTFSITQQMLKYIGQDMRYAVDQGKFSVYIGNSSDTQNERVFEVV